MLLQVRDLVFGYRGPEGQRTVLDHLNLSLARGEMLALLGQSGSGKSTLLNLISGIEIPDQGEVLIDGFNMAGRDDLARTLYRRRHIGFVYQFFNLIPTLKAWENVALVLELNGFTVRESRRRALSVLAEVGLESHTDHFPDQLSGGEQQRVAIARALCHKPALLLADEPTGNLDAQTGRRMMALLRQLVAGEGVSVIVVTHSQEVAGVADRCLSLVDGVLSEQVDRVW